MTTAFVLSGGASLGAVQVGMLQVLIDAGIRPDFLVGTSVGAVNALWVGGSGSRNAVEGLAELWRGLRPQDLFPVEPISSVMGLFGRHDYLVSAEGLRQFLDSRLPLHQLEHAQVPVHILTTDVLTGLTVRLSRGSAVEAALAALALPGVFPTVRIRGRQLIDGGFGTVALVESAVNLGANRIYVLPAGYACALTEAPTSPFEMALHASSMLLMQRVAANIARYEDEVELSVVPPLCPLAISPVDFSHADELIRRARESTQAWLAAGRLRRGQAALLAMHPRNRPVAGRPRE